MRPLLLLQLLVHAKERDGVSRHSARTGFGGAAALCFDLVYLDGMVQQTELLASCLLHVAWRAFRFRVSAHDQRKTFGGRGLRSPFRRDASVSQAKVSTIPT